MGATPWARRQSWSITWDSTRKTYKDAGSPNKPAPNPNNKRKNQNNG